MLGISDCWLQVVPTMSSAVEPSNANNDVMDGLTLYDHTGSHSSLLVPRPNASGCGSLPLWFISLICLGSYLASRLDRDPPGGEVVVSSL